MNVRRTAVCARSVRCHRSFQRGRWRLALGSIRALSCWAFDGRGGESTFAFTSAAQMTLTIGLRTPSAVLVRLFFASARSKMGLTCIVVIIVSSLSLFKVQRKATLDHKPLNTRYRVSFAGVISCEPTIQGAVDNLLPLLPLYRRC